MSIGPDALPLGKLIALDILFPPIGAAMWWLMSRGLAEVFQTGNVSERSRSFLRKGFWTVLIAAYLLMFGITLYAYLK